MLILIVFAANVTSAQETKSDARSLLRLFGGETSTDVLEIRRRSRQMQPEQRYAYLSQQVLPRDANEIRIAIDFLPTNPAPPVLEKYGSPEFSLWNASGDRRIPSGGVLVSPVIDLVESAQELGRLNELKVEVNRRSPVEPEQIKARCALLILIAAADGNREQYVARVNEFMNLVRESPITDIERATEMVVIWQGSSQDQTRGEIRDLLLFLREQTKFGTYRHRERVKRHIFSLHHLLDEEVIRKNSKQPVRVASETLEHWHVASRDRAVTRGNGYPNAVWTASPSRARHVSSHGADYLYFAIPLRGSFEIEGDLSTFAYREIRLAAGTVWAGPLHTHKRLQWGDFRGRKPDIPIDPPFTNMNDRMRVRVVVRDGMRTTYVNGRNVFTSAQGPGSEPWVAAVSPWHTSGEMQNVRITGTPEIPAEINLIANSDLPGWLPYYGESVGSPGSTWNLQQARRSTLIERLNPFRNDSPAILLGQKNYSLPGQYQESLLRYHRPMVEDGTIEYEFYYSPGESAVYPALDRCCFLFDAERAGVHWLTDGKYDRTGVDPANFTPVEKDQPIPLRDNDWNRVQLTLKGDVVDVALNGESILTRELEPQNLRTFGLFHYADQTSAMVRNLRWRGEWPQELPAPREQELADFSLEEELARGPELKTVFEHDFSQGLPQDTIWVAGHNWQELTEARSDGLWMSRSGGTFERNSLSLPFGLQGEFDIIWEFKGFESSVSKEGNGNLHVLILLEDKNATECRIYRKHFLPANGRHKQIVQPAIFQTMPNGKTHYGFPVEFAEESTGGKMRLVRRGTTLYFLYAEGDSEFYRLIHRATVPDAPVMSGGIKGIIETHREGETAAVWERVTIKAESTPDVLKSPALTLSDLNQQRSRLAQSLSFEFDQNSYPAQLQLWGEPMNVTRGIDGWLIRQPGFDAWKATGVRPHVALRGDFDVTLELDVLKLEQAKPGSESTVYLHAGLDAVWPSAVEIKYSKAAQSPRSLEIQVNVPGRDRGLRYDELKHDQAKYVTQLRLARRGPFAYLIARRSKEDEPEIFGRIKVGEADVPLDSLLAVVHTSGEGQETIVRFKSLEIHAEEFK